MESSDHAFEMRLLIVLSAETANIAIFQCCYIFNDIFLIVRLVLQRLLREGQLQLYLTQLQ